MTSAFDPRATTRRLALLATLSATLVLAACGNGDDDDKGNTNLRAINLTSDIASVDLYTSDTKRFGPLATDAIAPQITLGSDTYTLNVKRAGDAASLFTGSYSLAKDQHYTAVIYGRETAMRVLTLPEDESNTNVTAGTSRVRFLNATIDSGTVDVFLTSPTADLSVTSPTQGALTSGTLAGFRDISTGTYRLRVTAAGDATDVRMDVPVVTLADRQFTTLVLTAGAGGALLNGTQIVQQGAVTSSRNTKARLRLASSVERGGRITASIGGSPLFSDYTSPRVSAYGLVEAGDRAVGVAINGGAAATSTRTFAAGADYTLLVYGQATAAQVQLITDDNRVPTTTNRAKLRLVNGLAASDPLTLTPDAQTFAAISDIAAGTASAYATPSTVGSTRLEVTSPLSADPIFTQAVTGNATLLQSQGVYTVFILSGQTRVVDGVTVNAPAGRFVRDR